MATILEWLVHELAPHFSFGEEDLRSDCEELLRIQGMNAMYLYQGVEGRNDLLDKVKQWQLDKEYLASLDLHITIAKHIRACCQKNQIHGILDAWNGSTIDIDGHALTAELQRVIRTKLKVRAPPDCTESDNPGMKIKESFHLKPVEEFHRGLENFIGYPSLNDEIVAAMKIEHERDKPFSYVGKGKNEEVHPSVEWNIVVGNCKWKIKEINYQPTPNIKKRSIGLDLDLEHFMRLATEGNYSVAGLNTAEVIALRLWTGPMHKRYVGILREDDLDVSQGFQGRSVTIQADYVNTLHAINSGIAKLARVWNLPRCRKVYRGYNNMKMHELQKDSFNCAGGVERSFLATSEDFDVAVSYSGEEAFILEINVGQVNKGADLSWLSQFPHEKEILFNALSNVEFLGHPQVHFVHQKGKIQVYKVEITSNTKSKTLDQYVQLRKDLHLNMTEVLVGQALRMVGHYRQRASHELIQYLCDECEVYSKDLFDTGRNAQMEVFNEGREEYVHMVRGVITFQRQALAIIRLVSQWFENQEANPAHLKDLAEWQLKALRSAFEHFERPEVQMLILEHREQRFPESVFHAQEVDLGSISDYDSLVLTGRLVSLNPNLLALKLEAKWATADVWVGLFREFAQHSQTDLRINGLLLCRYASRTLQRLDIRNQDSHQASMLVGTLILHSGNTLTKLALHNCPIGCSAVETLGSAFSSLLNLVYFGVSECVVSDRGCTALGKTLNILTALKSLDLSHNKVRNTGALGLAPALSQLSALEVVDLSYNMVGDAGALVLASLTGIAELDLIDLRFNEVTLKTWQFGPQARLETNLLAELHCKDAVKCLVWNPEGSKIASLYYYQSIITVWNVQTAEQEASLKGDWFGEATEIAWSCEGSKLALWSANIAVIWDIQTEKQESEFHVSTVTECGETDEVITMDGSRRACASGHTIDIWDAKKVIHLKHISCKSETFDEENKESIESEGDCLRLAWSPDGCHIASGCNNGTIIIWDAHTGEQQALLNRHNGHSDEDEGEKDCLLSLHWSSDGSRLLSKFESTVIILNAQSWEKEEFQLKPHTLIEERLESSDLKSAFLISQHIIDIRDRRTKQRTQLQHSGSIRSMAWDPSGRKLASSTEDGEVYIWNADTGEQQARFRGGSQNKQCCINPLHSEMQYLHGYICTLAWSPEGSKIASLSTDYASIFIWDAQYEKQKLQLCNSSPVFSVAWSNDGSKLAGGLSSTIVVWDAQSGEHTAQLKEGNDEGFLSVAWSGCEIASKDADKNIIIWNPNNESLQQIKAITNRYTPVVWSPAGDKFASGQRATDGAISVWEAASQECLYPCRKQKSKFWDEDLNDVDVDHDGEDWSENFDLEKRLSLPMAWSPEGSKIAIVSHDDIIIIWDVETFQKTLQLVNTVPCTVFSVAWSPEGSKLASASQHGVVLWNAATGEQIVQLEGHSSAAFLSVAWNPMGSQIAAGSSEGTVIIWDEQTADEVVELTGHSLPVMSIAWSPEGSMLVSGSIDTTVVIWNVQTGEKRAQFKRRNDFVRSVGCRTDESKIVSKCCDNVIVASNEKTAKSSVNKSRLLHWAKHRIICHPKMEPEIVTGHIGVFLTSVSWSLEGSMIASGSCDKSIIIWDAKIGAQKAQLKGHFQPVCSVAWNPTVSIIASGSGDCNVGIWDGNSGKLKIQLKRHSAAVLSVAWNPEGSRLASGSHDQTIIVWDTERGEQIFQARGHTGSIFSVAWSLESSMIASGSSDKNIIIWDSATGKHIIQLKGHAGTVFSVAWSSKGSQMASGSYDNTIIIWDVGTGERKSQLKGHSASVFSVAWSPDGSNIASASYDRKIMIWDIRTEKLKTQLNGHTAEVLSVAWSCAGSQLASASADGTMIIWNAFDGKHDLQTRKRLQTKTREHVDSDSDNENSLEDLRILRQSANNALWNRNQEMRNQARELVNPAKCRDLFSQVKNSTTDLLSGDDNAQEPMLGLNNGVTANLTPSIYLMPLLHDFSFFREHFRCEEKWYNIEPFQAKSQAHVHALAIVSQCEAVETRKTASITYAHSFTLMPVCDTDEDRVKELQAFDNCHQIGFYHTLSQEESMYNSACSHQPIFGLHLQQAQTEKRILNIYGKADTPEDKCRYCIVQKSLWILQVLAQPDCQREDLMRKKMGNGKNVGDEFVIRQNSTQNTCHTNLSTGVLMIQQTYYILHSKTLCEDITMFDEAEGSANHKVVSWDAVVIVESHILGDTFGGNDKLVVGIMAKHFRNSIILSQTVSVRLTLNFERDGMVCKEGHDPLFCAMTFQVTTVNMGYTVDDPKHVLRRCQNQYMGMPRTYPIFYQESKEKEHPPTMNMCADVGCTPQAIMHVVGAGLPSTMVVPCLTGDVKNPYVVNILEKEDTLGHTAMHLSLVKTVRKYIRHICSTDSEDVMDAWQPLLKWEQRWRETLNTGQRDDLVKSIRDYDRILFSKRKLDATLPVDGTFLGHSAAEYKSKPELAAKYQIDTKHLHDTDATNPETLRLMRNSLLKMRGEYDEVEWEDLYISDMVRSEPYFALMTVGLNQRSIFERPWHSMAMLFYPLPLDINSMDSDPADTHIVCKPSVIKHANKHFPPQ